MSCKRKIIVRLKKSGYLVRVGCGKCPDCLKNKQKELALRLQYDLKSPRCIDSLFITLTYDDTHLEYDVVNEKTGEIYALPSVNKHTIQKYLKRVRKSLGYDSEKTQLYYYFTGEYGASKRPHYHAIIYLLGEHTMKCSLRHALKRNWKLCDWSKISDDKCFQSTKSIASNLYVAKHQVKRCQGTEFQAPYFQLRSKGIGYEFFKNKKDVEFLKRNMYLLFHNQTKVPAPRIYLDKLDLHRSELEVMQLQNEQNDKQLINYNNYVREQKILYPSLTVEDITKKFYQSELNKEIYKDKYFEIMYKKLSKSSNF